MDMSNNNKGMNSSQAKTVSPPPRVSDFSIDHILNRAGSQCNLVQEMKVNTGFFHLNTSTSSQLMSQQTQMFDWLYYTRYHPPRLPRTNNGFKQPVKRTPGRLPRVPFSPEQLKALECGYKKSMYLSSEEANELAKKLDLSSIRVKIWFQNRRARDRRENKSDLPSESMQQEWHENDSKSLFSHRFQEM